MEQAADSISLIDVETGKILEFNTAAHQQLGYSREEFEQLQLTDINVEYSARRSLWICGRNYPIQNNSNFETRHRKKNGEIMDVQVSAWPIFVHDRKCLAIIWSDISNRKRTEEQLRKLSMAVEQSPSSIVITDLNGNIEYVNEAFVRITGWQHDEVIGQNPCSASPIVMPPVKEHQLWVSITPG